MRYAAFAPLAALLALPALARGRSVEGDGRPTTERRNVPAFEGIRLDASADVTVRVGGERSVSVTTDGNLQPHLLTEVTKGILVVRTDDDLRPHGKARVEVIVPVLRSFDLGGSGDVRIDGGSGALALAIEGSGDLSWKGDATKLTARIEGSGNARLEGRADALQVSVDGSGDVDAVRLRAKDVSAKVEGSGDVDLTVDGGALTAVVDGSGDVTWRGQAKAESVVVSGSGTVARKE